MAPAEMMDDEARSAGGEWSVCTTGAGDWWRRRELVNSMATSHILLLVMATGQRIFTCTLGRLMRRACFSSNSPDEY